MIIEYDGSKFVGWQFQKNGTTIQGEIEKILKKIFKKNIKITGSGRTDTGVHALAQSANFKIDKYCCLLYIRLYHKPMYHKCI